MKIETNSTVFCQNLRCLRAKHYLSRHALSSLTGISIHTIRRIERGESTVIFTDNQLIRLREVFGLPLEDLFHTDLTAS